MRDYSKEIKKYLHINKHQTLKEAVHEALRTTIILGVIPSGERINELELSNNLNISRTPIRYALNKLKEELLVEHTPEVGMIVKGISIKDAYEIFKIRIALETLATKEAMQKMNAEDFAELEQLLLLGNQLNEEDRIDELLESFSRFNQFIFEKADMPRLRETILELKTYLDHFRDISIRSSERRSIALNEHWLIFRGMRNKDNEQIEMILKEHLTYSRNFIVKEMERHNIE